MQRKEYSLVVGGKTITAVFSDMVAQANGSVMMKCGETSILATAVMSGSTRDGIDYLPLTVDYEERYYASGRLPGGQYMRREGKPSEEAILTGRIVDRTIRPLFDQSIRNEIQVVVTTLSLDGENDPDTISVIGASLAIATSNIPWGGPVGSIRVVVNKDGTLGINSTHAERKDVILDSYICGRNNTINMIETESKEVSEDKIKEVFELAMSEITKIEDWQKKLVAEIGKEKKAIEKKVLSTEEIALYDTEIGSRLEAVTFSGSGSKPTHDLLNEWLKMYAEKFEKGDKNLAAHYFDNKVNDILHEQAIKNDRRPDGRKMDELRKIEASVGGISDIIHGCGLFYRGETHMLSVLTLGGPKDALKVDGAEVEGEKFFMHHYNFPPYSSGETGKIGNTNRRMIGHGALAEKALRATLPSRDVFPYTIRIVSDTMSSNGSTSQAAICASSLALMDGGVPISRPTAGIAMGLMMDSEGKYKVLTDIQGPEDHYGDMDFKVAGTRVGVAAIQLDIKMDGIPVKVLVEAMDQAKKARLEILDVIESALPAPRADLAVNAPRIAKIMINPEKIGGLIGPGGKMIHHIQDTTGVEINVEQDGTVIITGKKEGTATAKKMVEDITREFKIGDTMIGEVVKLADFGAFVKIGMDKDGLVHVSEIAPFRVDNVADYLKVGMKVPVIVKDKEGDRISLSIKRIKPDMFKAPAPATPRPPMTPPAAPTAPKI
ncbi:MAG: Polyribonucleotide nucleotidyltransferase [Parcubacteria group bacterium GW2011_GWF2_38_76]|nr:MAG: Polyribonucleotide nucleotidyltransferase [Parcubacteria group bacterium GW2011_GWF2_38_76]HBM45533.1 polyribonucleotide nucleotidyltransferase [Patescibacteria group bacterium]